MPPGVREELEVFIEMLKPDDLLNKARAVILNQVVGGWDLADGEDDDGDAVSAWRKADEMAQSVGRSLVKDSDVRAKFLPELLAVSHSNRAYECGLGLSEGDGDSWVMWGELVAAYKGIEDSVPNPAVLSGFISGVARFDRGEAGRILYAAVNDPDIMPLIPYLEARLGVDEVVISRLRRAINFGVDVWSFRYIANGSVSDSPSGPLAELLLDIAGMSGGVDVALDVLHMHFYSKRKAGEDVSGGLISVGRILLSRSGYGSDGRFCDFGAELLIDLCLEGGEGRIAAGIVCQRIRSLIDSYAVNSRDLVHTLTALFRVQPFIALDAFLLPDDSSDEGCLLSDELGVFAPCGGLDAVTLLQWANSDADSRYSILSSYLTMFDKNGDEDTGVSPIFMAVMEQSPDKKLFLGDFWDRIHPRSWSGTLLGDVLLRRKQHLLKLLEHSDENVREWLIENIPVLDRWVADERERFKEIEESFE